MAEQRERARRAGKFTAAGVEASEWVPVAPMEHQGFVGYEKLRVATEIHKWALKDGRYHVVLVDTPFYAESGGQVGDRGAIKADGMRLTVEDTLRVGDLTVCLCRPAGGPSDGSGLEQALGGKVTAEVDRGRRAPTTANHTATHLLHMALRRILGDHVHQSGSLVAPDHLRFDFTHWQRVEPEQLGEIERIVNGVVQDDHAVEYFTTAFDEALQLGATALFGEKYGDTVRVVRVGAESEPVSLELCGGCHVGRTGQVGPFVVTSEGSIASGVRRIEALTGAAAVGHIQAQRATLQRVSALVGASVSELDQRTEELVQHARQLEKRVKALEAEQSAQQAALLAAEAEELGGVRLILRSFDDQQPAALKTLAERLRTGASGTVAFLVSTLGGRLAIACAVSDDLAAAKPGISAAVLAKEAAAKAGGGGGGRPTLATAGAKHTDGLDAVLASVRDHIVTAPRMKSENST
jgi:alanyl-tRNA synthetase